LKHVDLFKTYLIMSTDSNIEENNNFGILHSLDSWYREFDYVTVFALALGEPNCQRCVEHW